MRMLDTKWMISDTLNNRDLTLLSGLSKDIRKEALTAKYRNNAFKFKMEYSTRYLEHPEYRQMVDKYIKEIQAKGLQLHEVKSINEAHGILDVEFAALTLTLPLGIWRNEKILNEEVEKVRKAINDTRLYLEFT